MHIIMQPSNSRYVKNRKSLNGHLYGVATVENTTISNSTFEEIFAEGEASVIGMPVGVVSTPDVVLVPNGIDEERAKKYTANRERLVGDADIVLGI